MNDMIPHADLSWFDVDEEYDLDEQPDIFATIIQEMRSGDDADRQTSKFLDFYQDAEDAKKTLIDEVLIHICGWSLASLIRMTKKKNSGAPGPEEKP
jgi:hypothetical protein